MRAMPRRWLRHHGVACCAYLHLALIPLVYVVTVSAADVYRGGGTHKPTLENYGSIGTSSQTREGSLSAKVRDQDDLFLVHTPSYTRPHRGKRGLTGSGATKEVEGGRDEYGREPGSREAGSAGVQPLALFSQLPPAPSPALLVGPHLDPPRTTSVRS